MNERMTNDRESRASALRYLAGFSLATVLTLRATPRLAAAANLRVGSAPNDELSPLLYAQAVGMFREAGLEIDLQLVASATTAAAAVVGGALDLARGSVFSLISAHARNVPLTMVAASSVQAGGGQNVGLLVPDEAALHTGADFNGKTVSVAGLNDIMVVAVRAWVDKSSGHSESVRFVELTGPQVGTALDSGRIDAAAVVNPNFAQMLATGKYRSLGDPGLAIAPHFLASAWFGMTDYVQHNAAAIKSFANVMTRASAYANEHPHETAPLLAKLTGVDVATIEHMTRAHYATALDPRDVQPLIDAAAKYGIIANSFSAREMFAPFAS
jgi:NitT/TauT family transport system substrate-binding protein